MTDADRIRELEAQIKLSVREAYEDAYREQHAIERHYEDELSRLRSEVRRETIEECARISQEFGEGCRCGLGADIAAKLRALADDGGKA